MACVREGVKGKCLKKLEQKKIELEKYVDHHAKKMASILSNIDKEEANIMLYKGKICKNEKKHRYYKRKKCAA